MDIHKVKETETSLKYKIRVRTYGFIDGKWWFIMNNKKIYTVDIEFYISADDDKMYGNALKYNNPLAEWW
jgi:Transcription initiation factor IIA, gamma subunit